MRDFEPIRLDVSIPEIGAEAGDWLTVDRAADPPQLVLIRRIPHERVEAVRRHLDRVLYFCNSVDAGSRRGAGLDVVR